MYVLSNAHPCGMVVRKEVAVKGKGTQKYKCLLSESIGKTAHFDANCMEIGFLLLKLLRFYVFKMAANGGRHFEINFKLKNIKLNSFLKSMHTHTHLTNVIFVYYANNHFMGLLYEFCRFIRHYWKEKQYPL